MCTITCIMAGIANLSKKEIQGARILEVGSRDVNGSLRPIYEIWRPQEYIGVDIQAGAGVDLICNAKQLVQTFGENSFDIVFSTEMLEHIFNWRKAISNIKRVCKPEGIIFITTVIIGFPFHEYPYDFWRFEIEDMKKIFSDCDILSLYIKERNIIMKAKKPKEFIENDLSEIALYNIVVNERVKTIDNHAFRTFKFHRQAVKRKMQKQIYKTRKFLQKLF